MSRVLKRPKRKLAGLTMHHLEELEHGHAWPYLRSDHSFQGDMDHMQAAWSEARGHVMKTWIKKHPGSRPYAWWAFDAPERRRPLHGRLHPFDNPARDEHIERLRIEHPNYCPDAHRLRFGKPSYLLINDDFETGYESELHYLFRLRLIGDEELDAAREAAWQA